MKMIFGRTLTARVLTGMGTALLLAACNSAQPDATPASANMGAADMSTMDMSFDAAAMAAALAAQPADIQARYNARHPAETLEFLGIAPGMVVVDALPGSEGKGWYTGILARYLGASDTPARLVGVDYSLDMWPEFGGFATPEFINGKRTWANEWVSGAQARAQAGDFGDANVDFAATTFGADNRAYSEMADAALLMRAFHNLNRFEAEGGYATEALEDLYAMLKPGAVVGVVQHRAAEDMPDDWADGSNGYVKQSEVVRRFENAGFRFEASSEINANPLDVPTVDDGVWRLPPSLRGAREDAELRAQREAIGESDRMTLRFRKPG